MDFYRSEEHTCELQSLRHLVCRLLLEKKQIVCEPMAIHGTDGRGDRRKRAAAVLGTCHRFGRCQRAAELLCAVGMNSLAFFFNHPATTGIYPLPLHDALPI